MESSTIPARKRVSSLVVELILYTLLAYVAYLAVVAFQDGRSYMRNPSIILFVFHTILLYLHEGGHFLFSFFGRTLYILGGSFWQVMFPLLAFVFALRERSAAAWFALFVTGFSIMDVSVYIRDAPARMLPLITRDKAGHDWHNLLRGWDMLDSAGILADIFYFLGALLVTAAVGIGLYLAVMSYFRPPVRVDAALEYSLSAQIQKQVDAKKEQWK